MTQERIQTRYRLAGPLNTRTEREQAVARTIEANKRDLYPLLERLVDEGNPAANLSQEHQARVLRVELSQDGSQGLAHLCYESNFFECCLIVDEYQQHQIAIPFRLEENELLFDLELPIQWHFNY
ncbi:hypothetical protein EHZ86_19785 [Aeromonas australiensis]|uniref:hypothetical protein n=1 Tax=Aeromonas australiensis TaxID=1114880 RepID=UPI001F2E3C9E|nr:hypothetical protein [Aeromonas australiensis]MCF3099448.1 hypothetical protein [Aeromonas australiensis]